MSIAGSGRVHVSGIGPSLQGDAAAAGTAATRASRGSSSSSQLEASRRFSTNGRKEAKRHIDFAYNEESTTRGESVKSTSNEEDYDGVVAVPLSEGKPEQYS